MSTTTTKKGTTHNAFVKVSLDSHQHISQSCAEIRGRVNVLSCPHMVTHLHQHVQRVEAVNLVAQSDEAVELCLDALEDFIHHQPHYIFPGNWKKKRTIAFKKKKKITSEMLAMICKNSLWWQGVFVFCLGRLFRWQASIEILRLWLTGQKRSNMTNLNKHLWMHIWMTLDLITR